MEREKLTELMCQNMQRDYCEVYCENPPCDIVVEAVDNLLANNVVIQKQGEWVSKSHEDGYGEFTLWHCSQCDVPSANKRNFCHNCGAKMGGDT